MFSLLADSSARIGAILSLRGRDVNRAACEVTFRKTKTDWRTVAIPPATIALLPEPGPTDLLFPGAKPGRPFRRESVRDVLHRAMRAIGVLDPEWLSTHSFRRAWVATSRREGIPAELAMKHTGHEDVKVFHAYQRNAVGDDMHDVAARVHAARERASARGGARVNGAQAGSEPANGQGVARAASNNGAACNCASSTNEAGESHRKGVSRLSPTISPQSLAAARSYDFTSEAASVAPTREPVKTCDTGQRETDRALESRGVDRRARILGRLDPVLATVARWADDDPAAMTRLVQDTDLRSQVLLALATDSSTAER